MSEKAITIVHEGEARWYLIDGRWYPSITTILSVLNKPGLMWWAANEERKLVTDTLLHVLTRERAHEPEFVLDEFIKMLDSAKAAWRAQKQAAEIGTQAHAWIEWETRRRLGQLGDEPALNDAAQWAVEHWKEWAKVVDFTPLATERVVWSRHGYAGTVDSVALVQGVQTVIDYKTGKAVYPEAFLQATAYVEALCPDPLPVYDALILRLPKRADDPVFEAVPVPRLPIEDFLAVARTWRCLRRLSGKPVDCPAKATA